MPELIQSLARGKQYPRNARSGGTLIMVDQQAGGLAVMPNSSGGNDRSALHGAKGRRYATPVGIAADSKEMGPRCSEDSTSVHPHEIDLDTPVGESRATAMIAEPHGLDATVE